ncbi:MAG: hypothetical protein J6Y23_04770 [Prevotella sp.]|nr:hypothetical protein [Prevotella sp.]
MRKIFLSLMMLVPIATLANREVITPDEGANENNVVTTTSFTGLPKADEQITFNNQQNNEPFFTAGFYNTGDYYNCLGIGMGLMFNIGRTSDMFNVSFGAEYIEYIAGDPRPDELKGKTGLVDAGGQIAFPVMVKLQLFRTSKWTKFYIGCGAEYGLKVYDGNVMKDYYEYNEVIRDKSVAIMPLIGWRARNVDFGVYCKYYFDKAFYNALPGTKDLGKNDIRIGYHLAYWF